MDLTDLEVDILEEMLHDSYELWEWYVFIRTYYPDMSESEVVEYGYNLFLTWIERDWLVFYCSRADMSLLPNVEFIQIIEELKDDAANPNRANIVFDLSEKAFLDVEWLPKPA